MTIYPGINCSNFDCVKERIAKCKELGAVIAHVDISDGKFTKTITWNDPEELRKTFSMSHSTCPELELHLMVQNPKEVLEAWRENDVRRVIVHVDAVEREEFDLIVEHSELNNIEVVPAVTANVSTRRILRYLDEFKFRSALVLAVAPGPSGQKFDDGALEVVRELKSKFPKLSIVVDGGVNPDVALRAKEAGADTLISTSYIWESKDPKSSYEKLKNL